MLNLRLMPLFSMAPMVMLAMLLHLTPMDTPPTLTPMVATPIPMVPDMVLTPTWDKIHTTFSFHNIHTELKIPIYESKQMIIIHEMPFKPVTNDPVLLLSEFVGIL